MDKYYQNPEVVDGVIFSHNIQPLNAREIIAVPKIFTSSTNQSTLEVSIDDCRQLAIDERRRRYLLSSITTRVLNVCLEFPSQREDWLKSSDIIGYDFEQSQGGAAMQPTTLMRAIETFAKIRRDMDGGRYLIEKTGYGSGQIARYRIAPDVRFIDQRTSK